jgi:hypothetical protein
VAGQGAVLRNPSQPFELRFVLYLKSPVSRGHLGISISNESNVIVAGWGFDRVELPAGAVEVSVVPQALPVRPGIYWIVAALFDGGNNLTGGRPIETWHATPPLVVDAIPIAHPQDEWSGVLNIPADISIGPASPQSSAPDFESATPL